MQFADFFFMKLNFVCCHAFTVFIVSVLFSALGTFSVSLIVFINIINGPLIKHFPCRLNVI